LEKRKLRKEIEFQLDSANNIRKLLNAKKQLTTLPSPQYSLPPGIRPFGKSMEEKSVGDITLMVYNPDGIVLTETIDCRLLLTILLAYHEGEAVRLYENCGERVEY
jgi:hypothetical protein